QEAPELPTADLRSDLGGRTAATAPDGDAELRGIVGAGDGLQGGGCPAYHQRLAGADIDVHGAVAFRDGLDRHVLAQLGDELIALVHELVRRLAVGGLG